MAAGLEFLLQALPATGSYFPMSLPAQPLNLRSCPGLNIIIALLWAFKSISLFNLLFCLGFLYSDLKGKAKGTG